MFQRKKDTEIDISNLNEIISIGKKFMKILYFMVIIALVLLGTYLIKEWKILHFIKDFLIVISPIFIGFIIAWLFDPFVRKLEKKKIPRLASCLIVYTIFIGCLFLLIYLFVPTLAHQIKDFIDTMPAILADLKQATNGIFEALNNKSGINGTALKEQIYLAIENFGLDITKNLPNTLFNVGKSIISGGMTSVLGLMIGFYMLFDFNKLNQNILDFIPRKWKTGYEELTKRINTSLRSYLQGLFSIMFLVFITQSIGLTLAGLEAPLLFALFCAITDVIPYFGPYIGAIPAVIVGFTMSPLVGICCVVSIVVVQLLENNFYQPLIMGHTMKLHPVTIMLGLLIFQHFFGIIGMIIATPVIACIKVIFNFANEKANLLEKITDIK